MFFDNAMLESITDFINIKIGLIRYIFQRDRNAKEMDVVEIWVLFVLLRIAGMMHPSYMDINDFYQTGGTGVEFFHLVMPKKQFQFLLRALQIDNVNTRDGQRELDQLVAIREIYEKFLTNSREAYLPSEHLTADEMMVPFWGRCPFMVYMPKNPTKYGIKVYGLRDVTSNYVFNFETSTTRG